MCVIRMVHKLLPIGIATDSVSVLSSGDYKVSHHNIFKSGQRKYFLSSL